MKRALTRRGFLKCLAATAAVAIAAPVIEPVVKHFVPPPAGWHPDSFNLKLPDWYAQRALRSLNDNLGVSMRMVKEYDINSDQFPVRIDCLYGWSVIQPKLAARISSLEDYEVTVEVGPSYSTPDA